MTNRFESDVEAFMDRELAAYLDPQGSEHAEQLQATRTNLKALESSIGKKAAGDALRALENSERQIMRTRQRSAAEIIAKACKRHGVIVTPGAPPKRQRKSAKAQAKEHSPAVAPATEGEPGPITF